MSDPSSQPSEPVDSPARRRFPILLRRAWYGLNQAFRRRIAHLGVTPDQFTVLRTLLESDPRGISQRELTELIGSDPNTIASLLERMSGNGLLERLPHERDGRALRIRLKPLGRKKYQEARQVAVDLQNEVLKPFEPGHRETLLAHLDQLSEACQLAVDSSPTSGSPRRRPGALAKRAKSPT